MPEPINTQYLQLERSKVFDAIRIIDKSGHGPVRLAEAGALWCTAYLTQAQVNVLKQNNIRLTKVQ